MAKQKQQQLSIKLKNHIESYQLFCECMDYNLAKLHMIQIKKLSKQLGIVL